MSAADYSMQRARLVDALGSVPPHLRETFVRACEALSVILAAVDLTNGEHS